MANENILSNESKNEISSFSGGDGNSIETAVIINANSTFDGIIKEIAYISSFHGDKGSGWNLKVQYLKKAGNKSYDILEVILNDGKVKTYYFDISKFFGKYGNISEKKEKLKSKISIFSLILSKIFYKIGIYKYDRKNYDGAVKIFSKAIKYNPHYFIYYSIRAKANENIVGKFKEVIMDYSKAIDLEPDIFKLYSYRGLVYFARRRFEEAILDLKKYVESVPYDSDGYYHLGLTYNGNEQYEKGIIEFTKAIMLDPNHAYAYNGRGVSLLNSKNYDEALKDFNKAIELKPFWIKPYLNKSILYNALNQYESSIYCLEKIKDPVTFLGGYDKISKIQDRRELNKIYDESFANKQLIKYYLGKNYCDMKNYDKAYYEFKELDRYFSLYRDIPLGDYYFYKGLIKLFSYDARKKGFGKDNFCDDFKYALKFGNKNSEEYIKKYCDGHDDT